MGKSKPAVLYAFTSAAGIAVLYGIYLRLVGINSTPLSVDEYYLTQSVLSILENGLPDFDCGGYYSRGLIQQYLSALLIYLTGHIEASMRLVPVFSNLACLAGVFVLARRTAGLIPACVTIVLFSLSLWEIEFARFARMYSMFQALIVWQVWLCLKVILDKREDYLKWMFLLSGTAILTYAGAIFVIALNAVPFLPWRTRINWRNLALFLLILVAAVLYVNTDWRHLGVEGYIYPADLDPDTIRKISPINFPNLSVVNNWDRSSPLAFFVFFPVLSFIWAIRRLYSVARFSLLGWITLSLCVLLPAVQIIGFPILLLPVLIFTGVFDKQLNDKNLRQLIVPLIVNLILWGFFWFSIGLQQALATGGSISSSLRPVLVNLLKYPNIFDNWLYIWLGNIPLITFSLLGLIVVGLFYLRFEQQENRTNWKLLLGCFGALCLLMGMVNFHYQTTRYSFFLYPLMLILAVSSAAFFAHRFGRSSIFHHGILVFIATLYMGFSEDYNFYHMTHLNSPDVMYRTIYPKNFREHYKERHDYLSVASFVNANHERDDIVIAAISAVDYYLDSLDYRYMNYKKFDFKNHPACNAERDIWTNAKLIYREETLLDIIHAQSGNTWVLVENSESVPEWFGNFIQIKSFDGIINVLKIPPLVERTKR